MRKIFFAFSCMIITNCGFTQAKKAVFIIIDGVSRDVLEKIATPYMDAIAKEGALIPAQQGGERGQYNETPTISAPGYNNVLTGVWYNKHNVPDNDISAPNYHYPTIFRLFENQFPEKSTAVFSSWEDNRTKLIGENLPATGRIRLDYHYDGLELDTVKFPHDRARKFMAEIDKSVTAEAAKQIAENGPDLSWVYLEYTDDMGHMYGDSPQYFDAVKAADSLVGQIWNSIQLRKKNFNEDWLIVVTTDHGRDAESGKDHGGQSDRERSSWIVTNGKALNNYSRSAEVSVVDILPTIAAFLGLEVPASQLRELDGKSLTGNLSLSKPEAVVSNGKINLTWIPQTTEGNVKVWVTTSNTYREAGKDDKYTLVGEVPVSAGKYGINTSRLPPSDFYKVVLEGKYNTVNRWVTKK